MATLDISDVRRTQLYRHYDADGQLLYVGISLSALLRTRQHRENSPWFANIAKITVETFPDRATAYDAETFAIENERPLYNVQKVLDGAKAESRAAEVRLAKMVIAAKITSLSPAYKVFEAAQELGLTSDHVTRLIKAKKIRACKIASQTIITGWAMLDFLEYVDASERIEI